MHFRYRLPTLPARTGLQSGAPRRDGNMADIDKIYLAGTLLERFGHNWCRKSVFVQKIHTAVSRAFDNSENQRLPKSPQFTYLWSRFCARYGITKPSPALLSPQPQPPPRHGCAPRRGYKSQLGTAEYDHTSTPSNSIYGPYSENDEWSEARQKPPCKRTCWTISRGTVENPDRLVKSVFATAPAHQHIFRRGAPR